MKEDNKPKSNAEFLVGAFVTMIACFCLIWMGWSIRGHYIPEETSDKEETSTEHTIKYLVTGDSILFEFGSYIRIAEVAWNNPEAEVIALYFKPWDKSGLPLLEKYVDFKDRFLGFHNPLIKYTWKDTCFSLQEER